MDIDRKKVVIWSKSEKDFIYEQLLKREGFSDSETRSVWLMASGAMNNISLDSDYYAYLDKLQLDYPNYDYI